MQYLRQEYLLVIFAYALIGCVPSKPISEKEDICHIEPSNENIPLSCGDATFEDISEKHKSIIFDIGRNIGVSLVNELNAHDYVGSKYYGEVSVCVNDTGQFYSVILKKPSHIKEINEAYLKSITAIESIEMPSNRCLVDFITSSPIVFEFTDKKD